MVWQMVRWYLFILVLGWLNFPLTTMLFPKLKCHGYAFSKIVGLLGWGFLYWIITIYQLLPNSLISAILALMILLLLNVLIYRHDKEKVRFRIRNERSFLVMVETIFLVAFTVGTIFRAMSPAISGTEKPMELAFINAILETPKFPPSDPWLSGYAISYYYFGYLMVALLARITHVSGAVAFNLAIALWAGFVCSTAYAILYELLYAYFSFMHRLTKHIKKKLLWLSLLAPFFLLVVSNAEGSLEMLHASGVFWTVDAQGNAQSDFWKWLDIQELNHPPKGQEQWIPQRIGGTWWWRASRVVSDYDAAGNFREVIDETPAFTFYLADLHPHLLSIPFFLITVALSFNLFCEGGEWLIRPSNWKEMIRQWEFWSTALLLGSILFINMWDFPACFGLFCLVFLLLILKRNRWSRSLLWEFIWKVILLGIACLIIYLPFFIGFSSQAGGILPSLVYRTRGIQFLVMFLPFLFLIFCYLFWLNKDKGSHTKKIFLYLILFFSFLSLVGLLFPLATKWAVSVWNGLQKRFGGFENQLMQAMQREHAFATLYGARDIDALLSETFKRRLRDSTVVIGLGLMLYFIVRAFFRKVVSSEERGGDLEGRKAPTHEFVLLLILIGCGLCLIPEFFFLVDVFTCRMNTIFKFYFQAWILWALAASFIFVILWNSLRKSWRAIYRFVSIAILLSCCTYSFFIYRDRIRYTQIENWTLDGSAFLKTTNAGDKAIIDHLISMPYGVVAEAVGGSYSLQF